MKKLITIILIFISGLSIAETQLAKRIRERREKNNPTRNMTDEQKQAYRSNNVERIKQLKKQRQIEKDKQREYNHTNRINVIIENLKK